MNEYHKWMKEWIINEWMSLSYYFFVCIYFICIIIYVLCGARRCIGATKLICGHKPIPDNYICVISVFVLLLYTCLVIFVEEISESHPRLEFRARSAVNGRLYAITNQESLKLEGNLGVLQVLVICVKYPFRTIRHSLAISYRLQYQLL